MQAISAKNELCVGFRHTLTEIGFFEPSPHIAVGLSGGSDSVALLHLAIDWARTTGATISALTVDHGLRQNSRDEAVRVGNKVRDLGVSHHILTWEGPKPTAGVQSAARQARYQLMQDWCKKNTALHLMVGHTLGDQVETHLMRKSHGSGARGLAGMSQIVELSGCRLIRPLMKETRASLQAYLEELGVEWIEDPSNQDERFERVRWRNQIARENLSTPNIYAKITEYGNNRVSENRLMTDYAVRAVYLHPFGHATVSLDVLNQMPKDMASNLLARVLTSIGGQPYAPGLKKMVPMLAQFRSTRHASYTVSGCRIIKDQQKLFIIREYRNLPAPVSIRPDDQVHWDNRFKMTFGDGIKKRNGPVTLRSFEDADWKLLKPETNKSQIGPRPLDICQSLPIISDNKGVLAVPHLNHVRSEKKDQYNNAGKIVEFLSFCPLISLSGSGFSVA